MDKRTFLKSVFLGSTGLLLSARSYKVNAAANRKKWDGKFILPELGFAYSALEPYIGTNSLQSHHKRLHAEYTEQLNVVVKESGLTGKTAFEILSAASRYPEAIRNTGGGYLNHKLFWKMLTPVQGQHPSGELMNAFTVDFGSFDAFRGSFLQAANSIPSEGWAWLIFSDKQLKITTTTGNNSPLMDTVSKQGTPLLCLDLWKHAYADTYGDDKTAYIQSFWKIVNWDFISLRYNRQRNGTRDKRRRTRNA